MDLKTAEEYLLQKDALLENPEKLYEAIKTIKNDKAFSSCEQIHHNISSSYQGAIEFLFELGTWLTYIDDDLNSTKNIIESVVMETILQTYDRNKAINCLSDDHLTSTMEWLSQMIQSQTWRQTIYELAQQPRNEDCPFLSLAMPCIAVDEKLIGELIGVPLAWNTLEIFLKCATYVLLPLLSVGDDLSEGLYLNSVAFLEMKPKILENEYVNKPSEHKLILGLNEIVLPEFYVTDTKTSDDIKNARQLLPHFLEMGCFSEHGYLILQCLLHCLVKQSKGHTAKKLSWLLESEATRRNRDVSRYTVSCCGATEVPDAAEAMRLILKNQKLLQPQIDIVVEACMKNPRLSSLLDLMRNPVFIVLLADSLFTSNDNLLTESEEKYALLYIWASASDLKLFNRVTEDGKTVQKILISEVMQAGSTCKQWHSMSMSGVTIRSFRDLPQLLGLLKSNRAVAFGVFRFLLATLREKKIDFQLNLETMKPFCIVANELAEYNPLLRSPLLALYTELVSSGAECVEDLSQLEYKRMLVRLMLNLVTCGHSIPVIESMKRLYYRNYIDVSLVRQFVIDLLSLAAPPYSRSFLEAFHPLVSDSGITDGLKLTSRDLVQDFINYYDRQMPAASSTKQISTYIPDKN